jgi:hypothetical protein
LTLLRRAATKYTRRRWSTRWCWKHNV